MISITHLTLAPQVALFTVLARIGLTLIHTLWEGLLVAVLLWVALTILSVRSPRARYFACCVAALAMMAGMALTFLLLPATGALPLSPSAERGRHEVAAAAGSDALSSAESSAESSPGASTAAHPRLAMFRRLYLMEGWRLLVTSCQRGATLLPALALAWAVSVLALAVRLIVGYVGVHQLRSRGTSPAEPYWQQRLLALACRMRIKQPVSLRQSAGITTPAVVGWLRPVILLPIGMCTGLSTAQVEMILAHELAHVGRQDYLVNLLLNVVETVLFYHPAIWWIAARAREERENACDDLALAAGNNDRLGYARALASLEEMRLPLPPFALAARGDNGTLLMRVRRLLGIPSTPAHAFRSRKTACKLAGTVILSGAVAAFLLVAGSIPAQSQEAAGQATTSAAGAPPTDDKPTDRNPGIHRAAIRALDVAADKGQPAAQQALHKLASTPDSSPLSGQTATPAPSPVISAVATPPTALERAWEQFVTVDTEVTRFDRAQQQMKPADREQEKQKSTAEFLALRDRYYDACSQFVRLAPQQDSRRPLVLLLSTGSDPKATPAEHTAVIDEILATPTAPAEVQVRALLLRESNAATAAKISEFLASHPQEPRRRELESKVALIRANNPSSPPAAPALPASNLPPDGDPSSEPRGDGTGIPVPSRPEAPSGPADKQTVTASTTASPNDERALLDLYKKRGYSIPESFIDERILAIVHRDFGDDAAAFLKNIQAKGYTEVTFRDALREMVIVEAMRQRMQAERSHP